MGINGLWEVLGDGEVRNIADFAAEHFRKHGRPLRVAVDEACWRFTNLTPEQVEKIREGEPAANPVEKVILWRILRLWRLNIQLLFVWDGLRKPGKGRGGGGKVDRKCVELLHRMFEILKVPYHQAPGEAEAECARLEMAGIVDAVWSDDGDSFMFGCQTLIKQHKVGGKRINDHVRIFRAETIAQEMDLDANSFVLFAVLTGGDYEKAGLPGCGPQTAKWVAQRSKGLAKALVEASDQDIPAWRSRLGNAMRKADIPSTFPNMKALNGYRRPAVSTEDQCHSIRRLRNGFDIKFDQAKARIELRERYNFTTREFLKHLAPIFLVRKLARLDSPNQREENLSFDVHLKPTRAKPHSQEDAPAKSEVSIMFAAPLLVDIDLTTAPPEEDWSKFAAQDGTPYDPMRNIKGEVLRCFLEHGLPPESYEAPVKPKKSRASKKKIPGDGEQSTEDVDADEVATEDASSSATISKKRKRPVKSSAGDAEQDEQPDSASPQKRARRSKDDVPGNTKATRGGKAKVRTPSPPPATFKRPESLILDAVVVDLCEDDSGTRPEQSEAGLFMSPASASSSAIRSRSGPAPYRPLRPLSQSQKAKDAQADKKRRSETPTSSQQGKPQGKTKAPAQAHRKSTQPKKVTTRESATATMKPTTPQISTPDAPVQAKKRGDHLSLGKSDTLQAADIVKATANHMPLADTLIPGENIPPATLRELRAAAFSRDIDVSKSQAQLAHVNVAPAVIPKVPVHREVIDLT